jgi:hypothetical protein
VSCLTSLTEGNVVRPKWRIHSEVKNGSLYFGLAHFNFVCNENSINFTMGQAAKYMQNSRSPFEHGIPSGLTEPGSINSPLHKGSQ